MVLDARVIRFIVTEAGTSCGSSFHNQRNTPMRFHTFVECLTTSTRVVRVIGPVMKEEAHIKLFKQELLSLVTDGKPEPMVIDLREMKFLSSAAVNILIILQRDVLKSAELLRLCCLHPDVERSLRIQRLVTDDAMTYFKTFPNVEAALADPWPVQA